MTGANVSNHVVKADSAVKWLAGRTSVDIRTALATHSTDWQTAVLPVREKTRKALKHG